MPVFAAVWLMVVVRCNLSQMSARPEDEPPPPFGSALYEQFDMAQSGALTTALVTSNALPIPPLIQLVLEYLRFRISEVTTTAISSRSHSSSRHHNSYTPAT